MIFRSPHADLEIPNVPLTDHVFQRAGALASKPALIDGPTGRAVTYGELTALVERAAAGLARRGFTKGDVLAVLSPNVPEYAVAFHSALRLGGTVTPVNPLCTAGEVAKQLNDSRAKLLVTVPQLLEKAREAQGESDVADLYVFGEAEGATPFAELLAGDAGGLPEVHIDPREDVAALPYSSGTTGLSKGVMLTHHNLVAALCQMEALDLVRESDTLLCVLPLFHIYGLQVILNYGLRMGATLVTLPRFELDEYLRCVQQHRVRFAHVVPPVIIGMLNHPSLESYDLSSLEVVFSGAAPLGSELTRQCTERLGCSIIQGYGMTETSPAITVSPSDKGRQRAGSVGVCVPNTECKLVDMQTGEEVGAGREGEICARGPQVMKGYLGNPSATAQTIDPDGWLHTGDIGYADEEGNFYVVDRAKELIKYKGFQVAPAELEALLLTHPSVADAAVVPSPDDEAGEVPKAFVVLRGGGDGANGATPEEIMSFVAERVSPHKKVRRLEFVGQIPKSPSGKILRRVLVQKEREREKAAGS
jgi:acyl-CoA synthetase (AMP-forming)/AMP-acid ligase II